MKFMKRVLPMLLALTLCLSLCACGGNQTAEDQLFAEKYMKGVKHDGLRIQADTATEMQVTYAAAFLTGIEASQPHEECEHLRYLTLYYKINLDNGAWYYPVNAMLPCESAEDLYMNNYYSSSANYGSIQYGLESHTFALTEEELAAYRATPGWEKLSDKQIHLAAVVDSYVTTLNLDLNSDQVIADYNDAFVFAQVTLDNGRTVLIQTNELNQGVDGEFCVAATLVSIENLDNLSDADSAVLDEFMQYYNLYQWFD